MTKEKWLDSFSKFGMGGMNTTSDGIYLLAGQQSRQRLFPVCPTDSETENIFKRDSPADWCICVVA